MSAPEDNNEGLPLVEKDNSGDPVERALDMLKPALQKLGFGGIMGYCSGMALKKVGKAVAFTVGLGFVAVQTAVAAGYIEVNWGKVANDTVVKPLDASGNGKLDFEDIKIWWRKFRRVMTHQLPDAAGFSAGFLFGVKYG